jgi:hypothetical protein
MKRFTVVGILAAMLVFGAGLAHATMQAPAVLDDKQQVWSVFGMGLGNNSFASGGGGAQVAGPSGILQYSPYFFNNTNPTSSRSAIFTKFNQTGDTYTYNGSLSVYNVTASATLDAMNMTWMPDKNYYLNELGPLSQVAGLIKMDGNLTYGASNRYMYIFAAPDYSLMVAIQNATLNATGFRQGGMRGDIGGQYDWKLGPFNASDIYRGVSLFPMVQRNDADVTRKSTNLGGTWRMISLILDGQNATTYRAGELTFHTDANLTEWTGYDGYSGSTNSSIRYRTIVDDNVGEAFSVRNESFQQPEAEVLILNATIGNDNQTFIGWNAPSIPDGVGKGLVVGVKDGTIGSASDFKNRGLRIVTFGASTGPGAAAHTAGNATGQMMQMTLDSNAKMTEAKYTIFGNTKAFGAGTAHVDTSTTANLAEYSLSLGTCTVGGVEFRELTVLDKDGDDVGADFFGVWNKEKTFAVGIWNNTYNGGSHQLAFIFPTAAQTSNFTVAPENSWKKVANYTDVWKEFSITTDYNGKVQYTAEKLRSDYGLPDDFTPLTGVKYFNASAAGIDPEDNDVGYGLGVVRFVGSYDVAGLAGPVDELRLYKLINATDGDPIDNSQYSKKLFTQKFEKTDENGSWWLEDPNSGNVIGSESDLNPSTTYRLCFVIQDGGSYDLARTHNGRVHILDPQVLGAAPAAAAGDSSSSSTGCVFNPAAGFGLEWLLLLLAPAIGIVRSRFKK